MSIDKMLIIILKFTLTASLGGVSPFVWADDCRQGDALFQQAKKEKRPDQRLPLAKQVVGLCPSFNGWFMLGATYQELHNHREAANAFWEARNRAKNSRVEALAIGRLGEEKAAMGEVAEGKALLRRARELHPDPVPAWMIEVMKEIDLRQEQQGIVVAAEISRSLDGLTSKGIGVMRIKPAMDLRVPFDYDQDEPNTEGKKQVKELAAAMDQGGRCFRLIGHTDRQGNASYNDELSQRRAESVRRGVSAIHQALKNRVTTEGRGERELLYPGNNEEDHRLNRRVEVLVESRCGG